MKKIKKYQEQNPDTYGIFLETAHPVKFLDIVEETLHVKLEIPTQIQKVMGKTKKSIKISAYDGLKDFLLKS